MRKHLLYISLVILVISSCHVTRVKEVNYKKGAILDTLIGKSQDTSVASFVINVIDIEKKYKLPWVTIEVSNNQEKHIYTVNDKGYLLVPEIKEGIYDLKITYVGYETLNIEKIEFSNRNDVWLTVGLLQWHMPGHL